MNHENSASLCATHRTTNPPCASCTSELKAEGWIDPWLDEEKLYPGQDWDLEIEKAVEAAHAVIVFLSNNSVTKEGYIQRELRFVLRIADFKPEGTVFVIPVRLDDCQMPRRLSMWQYVDNFPERRKEWAFQRLLGSLKVRAEKLDVPMNNPAEEQTHREVAEKSERAVRERIENKDKDRKEKEAGEKAAREANGGIPNLDETSNVAGIAPSIINDLQGQIEEKTQPDITAWLRNVDVDAESTKTDTSKQSAEGTPEDDFRSWLAGLEEVNRTRATEFAKRQ